MVTMEQVIYYPKSLINGTCFKNFRYNNTENPKEVVIIKVLCAAIIAGIIAGIFGLMAAPVTFIVVGGLAFTYMTAHGKQPPSQDFIDNVLLKAKKTHINELPDFSVS